MRKSHGSQYIQGNRRKNGCFLEASFWLLINMAHCNSVNYFLLIHDVSGTFLGKVHMQWKMRQMYSVIPALESRRGIHS